MDLFINHILSENAGNAPVLLNEDINYKTSVQNCINDWDNFCLTFLNHPKCPSYFTQKTLNNVHKTFKYGCLRSTEWTFIYEMWMYLYH